MKTRHIDKQETLRIKEDQEREKYVHAALKQLSTMSDVGKRGFIRAALNSAWINGRNQILCRNQQEVA